MKIEARRGGAMSQWRQRLMHAAASQETRKSANGLPDVRQRQEEFHLQVKRGARASQHLDFGLQNCETIHFCGFKSPCLWYFVVAVLRNEYNQATKVSDAVPVSVGPQEILMTTPPKWRKIRGPWLVKFYYTGMQQKNPPVHYWILTLWRIYEE